MATTFAKLNQAVADHKSHRSQLISVAFSAAGLSTSPGGYPVNPDETEAYDAGFQRGVYWVYTEALAGHHVGVDDRAYLLDGTASADGVYNGWNTAVRALQDQGLA